MIKPALKKLLLSLDPAVGEASRWLNGERGTVRAICLHAMRTTGGTSPGVPPGFETDLGELRTLVEQLLRKGYRFITPADLTRDLDPRGTYFMLTFDDGYFTASLAVELLKQYGVPVTLFICSYFIERQMAHWSDALHRGCEKGAPDIKARATEHRLRATPQPEREQWLLDTFGRDSLVPLGDADRPLTSAELKRLWRLGNVEIGNHSWSHADLSRLSAAGIEDELERVQRYVHDLVGVRPRSMSFPYGFYNDTAIDVVRRMGFTSAFTTIPRRHSVASLTHGDFALVGRFATWNHRRPFARHVLRLRHGSLFSDRFLETSSSRPETSAS